LYSCKDEFLKWLLWTQHVVLQW